jgi:hypothetical protein
VNNFGLLVDLVSRFPAPHSICYGYDSLTTLPRCTTCYVASVSLMTYAVMIISVVCQIRRRFMDASVLWGIDVMIKKSRTGLALRLDLAGTSSEGINDK